MIALLVGALLAAAPFEGRNPDPEAAKNAAAHPPGKDAWASLSPELRVKVLEAYARRPLSERLVEASRHFLNTPYIISPLGEGKGRDPDPTLRYDAVDCLTFVEESIALALAKGPDEVELLLTQLRYGHEPLYEDRNHLMEAQWLPNNERKGFIRDVTRLYGGDATEQVTKRLAPEAWMSGTGRALGLPKERHVTGDFTLDIIPLAKVLEHAKGIPSGTILVVVREDAPFRVTRITHLGFVIQRGGRTYMRHAALSVYGRVVDEDLESFVSRNLKYDKWRVTGVSLFEVRAPEAGASSAR